MDDKTKDPNAAQGPTPPVQGQVPPAGPALTKHETANFRRSLNEDFETYFRESSTL